MASVGLQLRPLPPEPTTYEIWRENRPQYLVAYNLAFNAGKYATQQAEAEPANEAKDNIISAGVDGYLLVELFNRRAILTEGPCIYLSKELRSEDREGADANDTVFKVGKFYCDRFLRLFRTTTTAYPSPSLHFSRPFFDTVEDMSTDYMMADSKDDRTAKRKVRVPILYIMPSRLPNQVLARDGYRRILKGNFDDKSMNRDRELNEMRAHLGAGIATVAACHILSESTMQSVDPTGGSWDSRVMDKVQTRHATAAMSIFQHFGFKNLAQSLIAENDAHSLGILLSLNPIRHNYFDGLNL